MSHETCLVQLVISAERLIDLTSAEQLEPSRTHVRQRIRHGFLELRREGHHKTVLWTLVLVVYLQMESFKTPRGCEVFSRWRKSAGTK